MKYVDICIALYDYQAQNDEEISFNADNILYILENSDRDWFKAQLKSDQDGPIGLVPSNYIEKAKSIGSVKALYDYQSRSKEEISFKENDTLILYEKDDPDWYVVEAANGDLGLAPSNYVEINTQPSPAPPAAITTPSPPQKQQQWAVAIYSFKPEGQEETYLHENEKVLVTENNNPDWWTVQHKDGTSGIVPASYVQLQDGNDQQQDEDNRKKQQEDEIRKRQQEEENRKKQQEQDRKRQEELRQQQEQDRKRREEEEKRQKELAEYNRIKELEEKEKERKAEAERRKRLQEEAKARELEIKKQQQQLAPPAVPSPQLGSPRRSQIPAPPPPTHNDPNKPNPAKVRTWTDNTGAFKVEAQLVSCNNGKIRLHKVNGVKIDVPVGKMCNEDLQYVERETGLKLLEDRNDNIPLARLKFNWLDYFKRMNLPLSASTEYAGTFEANQLTEKDIERLTYRQMKMLGMSENHVHRFQRYIETNRAEPPSDDESAPKPKLKIKKSVTFGAVSYIPYPDEEGDDVDWQIEQDERYARQLQEQEQNHVGLQRRGTGRPTPTHSAPQNVNFSVLTPQQFQPPAPTAVSTPPIQPSPAVTPPAVNPPSTNNNNQLKPGFEDDAWAPRSSPSLNNNTRSISSPARSRPTPQVSQQTMVDPELLAKWSGSPALLAANSRPVPAPPVVANNFAPIQQQTSFTQQQSNFTPLQQQPTASSFTPLQQQPTANSFTSLQQQPTANNYTSLQQQPTANSFTSLQQQNSFTSLPKNLQQQNSFSSLPQQNSFTGSLQPSNSSQTSLRFQQPSPMMNAATPFQSSPSYQNVPLQSVLPAPLIPQATANTSFTPPPVHQNSFNVVQPQMTGRNWTTATPDNPFGSGAAANFQQPQNTGFVPIVDPNDKYAVFKTMNASAPSVFNTGP